MVETKIIWAHCSRQAGHPENSLQVWCAKCIGQNDASFPSPLRMVPGPTFPSCQPSPLPPKHKSVAPPGSDVCSRVLGTGLKYSSLFLMITTQQEGGGGGCIYFHMAHGFQRKQHRFLEREERRKETEGQRDKRQREKSPHWFSISWLNFSEASRNFPLRFNKTLLFL